jgi:hypothetical protein
LRVELRGVAADGETATEQWQLDAARAAASLSLLPLLKGEIRVHDLDLVDIDLRLRPPPTSEQEQAAISSYFPVIRNRDPAALAEPKQDSGTLALRIDDIHVRGRHAFWVSHLRGTLPGELRGSFSLDSQAGRVGLAGGALDVILESLQIADVQHMTDQASIRGRIEVPPFVISEATGIAALTVPELDAQIDLPVQDLRFLTLLTGDLGAIELNGKGRLRGRVNYSHGELLGGSELTVEAHELAMGLARYLFSGDGTVELRVDPEDPDQADLLVRFDAVQAALLAEQAGGAADRADARALPLFSGHGLAALLHAKTRDGAPEADLGLTLTIPAMEVPDLAVYSRLLPEKWDLQIVGGTGTVKGRMQVDPDLLTLELELELDLDSDRAEVRSRNRHATTDLRLQLRTTLGGSDGTILDLSGTSLRIDDTEVATVEPSESGPESEQRHAQPWKAELKLNEGALTLPMQASQPGAHRIPAVAKALAEQGFGALLATASGRLSATLTVSQLDWIAQLLNRPLNLGLSGAGEIDAEIWLADGWPAQGTTLTMPSEELAFGLLEHRVDGRGQASLKIEKGGKRPELRLTVGLKDAVLHRRGEAEPSIGEVRLDAEILVADPFADQPGTADVALKLHSARVRDMSSYNAYLPAHLPFSLVSGEASLVGDLKLGPDTAIGALLLVADDVHIALDETELSGDLRIDLLIRDGSALDMRFDITGSAIAVDAFRVTGRTASAGASDWHAQLQLEDTEVSWQKPMELDMTAGITIKDTRPFVALLDNAREEHGWIDNILTAENLGGHIRLAIDGDSAVIEDAMVNAAQIGVHAKGQSDASGREAMLLVRW